MKPDLDRELNKLDRDIQQFHVDSRRFLAGDLDIPPEDLMERIAGTIRKMRVRGVRGVADNFRLNSLEARYNSHRELHNRRMRESEQSKARRHPSIRQEADPSKGIVFGENGDRHAVESLYKGLFLKSGTRNPAMDLERFRSYIHRQADTIREKTGCRDIQFRIDVQDDGKAKIKARPIRRR
ncbi:MAG: MXAN_5187 C-terminal domain-containing protein [Acidobacteriota bacterium]